MTEPAVSAAPQRPFTQPWADALCAVIAADAAYRTAARSWTWPVALVLEAAPDRGYPDDVAVELALDRGACHGAQLVPADAVAAPIVLAGSYATWEQVGRGTLDAVPAVATGRLRLTRGSLTTLMMNMSAATALVECARKVGTLYE